VKIIINAECLYRYMKRYRGDLSIFRSILKYVENDPNILAVVVYGSFLTRSNYRDIDLCLINYPDLPKVDPDTLLYYKGAFNDIFDINFFNLMPLVLQYSVFKSGELLFCRNEEILYDLHVKTIKDYELFYPRFKELLEIKLKHGNSSG
jgi:predicted nucleotidyltransferase